MIRVEYVGLPESVSDLKDVFDLLCLCDNEFVPPLSRRHSSTQKGFTDGAEDSAKPDFYFEALRSQHFFMARKEDGHVAAFLTFRPNYVCDALADCGASNYITTLCVHPALRGQGLSVALYNALERDLPEDLRTRYITTRTWSGNAAQTHVLPKLGYRAVCVLKNDRGNDIDTLYYAKDCLNLY